MKTLNWIKLILNPNKKRIKIFLDMDNTLASFSSGKIGHNLSVEKMHNEGFYRNLEPYEDINMYEKLQKIGYDIYIVSACIDSPYCEGEKLEWLEEHMPFIPKDNILFCMTGENKATTVKKLFKKINKDFFLIDDYGRNLEDWITAGGTAIKTSNNKGKERSIPTIFGHKDIIKVLAERI